MNSKNLISELKFKAIRSSGAGGQHVNKVSSKVELSFSILDSESLSNTEKERLFLKLDARLTKNGVLILHCDEARSQHKNKDLVVKRFLDVLKKALYIPKKRKPTKPSKSSVEKRLKFKKIAASKKANRKKPNLD
ncbi:alternative ribosome rescue aminoacyl-tRNA hydrolase ArfB [uncultured Croceitalea sp.]|uniref:alternative ribosome rescue aminoacyl-tRNA hydrolase ArfB n=1 Tax=uncultured Croceitalea sp. TaxID=1798908 RepID=UPI00374F301D